MLAICAGALLLGGFATMARPQPSPRRQPERVAPASIAVRANAASDLDAITAYASTKGYGVIQRIEGALPALQLTPPADVGTDRAFADFGGLPGVTYVEPAYRVRSADVPADPLYARESAYLTVEHAPQAWDVEKGNPGVLVAVLDSGIDAAHPDLQGRISTNQREIAGNGVDDDQDGCIDDVNGCAFVRDPSSGCAPATEGLVRDDFGHGTFVAGIIAASGNGKGMVGIARGVTVLPVKVLDCEGEGNVLEVAQGILYAAERGARIINVSLGGDIDSQFMREATRIAQQQYGVLIVAASGNGGGDGVSYPARYDGVLAVGAASGTDPAKRAAFSATGPEVGVVAVGEGIVGTVPAASCNVFLPCINGTPYAAGDGTSFAAPQVTGLAALVLSHTPNAKPDAIIRAIESTAAPLPPGDRSDWAGHGRIDMFAAVNAIIGYRLGVPGLTRN